ncbi:26S protease regulatory subunit 10B [Tupaia chinensis]|uniref:26S protease regulatory subunit 10B n=1 Tax=Tupaia chinensis TaxID=246437 RepID=L9KXN0_TUPCH|nr:26S protease regulatory subunit 10B [Tupaia chinensis]
MVDPRDEALQDYRKELLEHKEMDGRLKELREQWKELIKQYEKDVELTEQEEARESDFKQTCGLTGCGQALYTLDSREGWGDCALPLPLLSVPGDEAHVTGLLPTPSLLQRLKVSPNREKPWSAGRFFSICVKKKSGQREHKSNGIYERRAQPPAASTGSAKGLDPGSGLHVAEYHQAAGHRRREQCKRQRS